MPEWYLLTLDMHGGIRNRWVRNPHVDDDLDCWVGVDHLGKTRMWSKDARWALVEQDELPPSRQQEHAEVVG